MSSSAKNAKNAPKKAIWTTADDQALVAELLAQKDAGKQADNNWKASVWPACELALQGSEVRSGGAKKLAKGCKDHWNYVCILFLMLCPFSYVSLDQRIFLYYQEDSRAFWCGLG